MYLDIFLADFAVFRVFLEFRGISRKYLNFAVRNIRSPVYRYKGTELFQNGKHSKDIICYFRKIEFLEQCAVQRFPKKKRRFTCGKGQ